MSRCPSVILILALASFCACLSKPAGPAPATPAPATPRAAPLPDAGLLIKRLATQDGCKDSTAEMRLAIEEPGGRHEQLSFRLQRKYSPTEVSTLLTVVAPREESEKALLAFEREGRPTDALSYLAGLKRLAHFASNSTLSFRGARLTVQELLGLELTQYTTAPPERAGQGDGGLIKIEFAEKPDRRLAFPRIVGFFRESDQHPSRFELYNSRGELAKTARIEEVKQVQGYQTITRVAIEDHQQGQKLRLETLTVKYDRALSDTIFSEDHLVKAVSEASRRLVGG